MYQEIHNKTFTFKVIVYISKLDPIQKIKNIMRYFILLVTMIDNNHAFFHYFIEKGLTGYAIQVLKGR